MKKITVPSAGENKQIKTTGLAVQIIQAPNYANLDDCPRLAFNNPGLDWPIESGDQVPCGNCEFQSLVITGTDKSAGDELRIQSLNVCVEPFKTSDRRQVKKFISGTTFIKSATDAAQSFSEMELIREGKLPSRIQIEARKNPITYDFNKAPGQSDESHLLIPADETAPRRGDLIAIKGINFILKFQFANAISGSAGNLVVSPEY